MQGQGPPLRIPNGINRNRMNLIMAVLTKHARLRLHTVDCHTNVVGGLLLTEPATDLAVALAIASSYFDRPISPDLAAIGEIGTASHNLRACCISLSKSSLHISTVSDNALPLQFGLSTAAESSLCVYTHAHLVQTCEKLGNMQGWAVSCGRPIT